MPAVVIDTYRLLTALKGTGKSANFTADEIAHAVDVAQAGSDVLTKSDFALAKSDFDAQFVDVKKQFGDIDTRFAKLEARIDAFEVKFDVRFDQLRAEIKAEVKASEVQLLIWLSGIVLASNGIVIALLGRFAHVY